MVGVVDGLGDGVFGEVDVEDVFCCLVVVDVDFVGEVVGVVEF